MDDKKVTDSDDEFHFTEAEETKSTGYTVPSEFSDKRAGKINRRNILIAVGIIIVALSLYKLIGVFFGSSEVKKTTTAVTTVVPPVANVPITPAVQIQPQPQTANNVSDLTNQLSEMHANNVAANQQMATISEQLSTLTSTTQKLGNAVTNINQQLESLSTQVQTTQAMVDALKVKPKVPIKHPKIKYVYVYIPKWYVQAIIPGRAWLVQANGKTITVQQGDVLTGYGKVTYISAVHGIVKTSSGVVIRFNNI